MSLLRPHLLGATCATFLLAAAPARAGWPPNGRALCDFGGVVGVLIAPDGNGGAFVQWTKPGTPDFSDLFMQHVTASGDIPSGWPPNGFPVVEDPNQQSSGSKTLCADGLGGVLSIWIDLRNAYPNGTTSHDVYAQRVLADGSIAPGWPINGAPATRAPGAQRAECVIPDGLGGAFATWDDDATHDIYLQHLTAVGVPAPGWPADGLPVCTENSYQCCPQLASDGHGGVFVVWTDARGLPPDTPSPTYGQHVSGIGVVDPAWPANGALLVGSVLRDVMPDGAGGFYVCTCTFSNQLFDDAYFLSRFTSAGVLASGWPAGGVPVCTASKDRNSIGMVADGAGGVLLAWCDYRDIYDDDVFAMRIEGDGMRSPGWPADGLRVTDNTGLDDFVGLAPDGAGGAYLTWEQYYTVIGNRVVVHHLTGAGGVAAGWPAGGLVIPDSVETRGPKITSDGVGGAIAAWERLGPGQIRALRLDADGPVPVLVSLVSAEAETDRVRLTWFVADGASLLATVERRSESSDWSPLGTIAPDGSGKLSYEDRDVTSGARYAYRLAYAGDGGIAYTAETWVTVPALRFALRGLTPNPSAGDPVVAFSLARTEPAFLELYDLSGRSVLSREVGSLGTGTHSLRLGTRLPAGVYTLRLRQGEAVAVTRAVILR